MLVPSRITFATALAPTTTIIRGKFTKESGLMTSGMVEGNILSHLDRLLSMEIGTREFSMVMPKSFMVMVIDLLVLLGMV